MPAKRSNPLTRELILTAALQLIDNEGIDALSMRRLARTLGVEAMSLYHHFPSKQALLDGVVDLALAAQASPPGAAGDDWRDIVTAAVCSFRRALTAHPNVLPLMVAQPPTSPEASAMYIEAPLGFLTARGFADKDASELFEAVFAMSFGHALLATNYPPIERPGVPRVEFSERSFERSVRVLLAGYEQWRVPRGE